MTALAAEDPTEITLGPPARGHGGSVRWLGQVASWTVMLGVGAILALSVFIPRAVGATPYVIETGSMRPSLPPGTIVVAKPGDPLSISAGDVITYQLRSGDPTVVTHRVVTVGYDGLGSPRWRTQGDANNVPDQQWVLPEQVRGEKWYAVPYVGHITSLVTQQQRGVISGLVVASLLGYAGVQFRSASRDRRRHAGGEPG